MQANFLIINYLNSRDLTWLGPVCTVVASSFFTKNLQAAGFLRQPPGDCNLQCM